MLIKKTCILSFGEIRIIGIHSQVFKLGLYRVQLPLAVPILIDSEDLSQPNQRCHEPKKQRHNSKQPDGSFVNHRYSPKYRHLQI